MGWSGFGDANPPLDPTVSVFENGNSSPTDRTFGLGRNRVVIGWFGRVVELRLGLDSPNKEENFICSIMDPPNEHCPKSPPQIHAISQLVVENFFVYYS